MRRSWPWRNRSTLIPPPQSPPSAVPCGSPRRRCIAISRAVASTPATARASGFPPEPMRKGVIQLPQAKYQVTLAVDGKHAVSVQSDDPAAVTEGLVWANDIYKKLQRLGQSNGASRPVELSV